MNTLTIQLPDSLEKTIEEFANSEATVGRREDFDKYLAAIPDVPPLPGDEK